MSPSRPSVDHLFALSTQVIRELQSIGKTNALHGGDAIGLLVIAMGRFYGKLALRNTIKNSEDAWAHLQQTKDLFLLGFKGERGHEN
jgi:hypothetical protein